MVPDLWRYPHRLSTIDALEQRHGKGKHVLLHCPNEGEDHGRQDQTLRLLTEGLGNPPQFYTKISPAPGSKPIIVLPGRLDNQEDGMLMFLGFWLSLDPLHIALLLVRIRCLCVSHFDFDDNKGFL